MPFNQNSKEKKTERENFVSSLEFPFFQNCFLVIVIFLYRKKKGMKPTATLRKLQEKKQHEWKLLLSRLIYLLKTEMPRFLRQKFSKKVSFYCIVVFFAVGSRKRQFITHAQIKEEHTFFPKKEEEEEEATLIISLQEKFQPRKKKASSMHNVGKGEEASSRPDQK